MIVEELKPGNKPSEQWQSAVYLEQGDSTVVGPFMRFYVGGRHAHTRIPYTQHAGCLAGRVTCNRREMSTLLRKHARKLLLALRQEGHDGLQCGGGAAAGRHHCSWGASAQATAHVYRHWQH